MTEVNTYQVVVEMTVRRTMRIEAADQETAAAKLATRSTADETVLSEPAPQIQSIVRVPGRYASEPKPAYIPKYWAATADPPRWAPGLARWLDEQVYDAVTSYVKDGTLWLHPESLRFEFRTPEAMNHLVASFDFADVLDWVEWHVCSDGKVDLEDEEAITQGRRLRARLVQAIAEIDAALPPAA